MICLASSISPAASFSRLASSNPNRGGEEGLRVADIDNIGSAVVAAGVPAAASGEEIIVEINSFCLQGDFTHSKIDQRRKERREGGGRNK